jgi:hypothetical protein
MAAQFLTLRSCGQNGVWRLLEQSKAAAPTLALQGGIAAASMPT